MTEANRGIIIIENGDQGAADKGKRRVGKGREEKRKEMERKGKGGREGKRNFLT